LTLQLRVGGPIHLAHAAFPDLGVDFVRAEAGTGANQFAPEYTGGTASRVRLNPG
jgi:hypothetical protein